MGPFPSGESVLVVTDYYSRYVEAEVLKLTITSKVLEKLDCIFATHGLPRSITSENVPQLKSTEFKQYLGENGIQHRRVTPLWPAANCQVERQNRTLLKGIRTAVTQGRDWKRDLP